MDMQAALIAFYQAVRTDYRIRNIHIAIFTALMVERVEQGFINPLLLYSRDMMQSVKVTKTSTYCKCLSELSAYGYLLYEPSFKKNVPSRIFFKQ